jgi:phage baseplate assembly protein V
VDIESILKNLFRVGKVSSTNPAAVTVRVTFTDKDNMVSYDLPVLQDSTKDNQDYYMPDIDELVLCLFLPNGLAQGFCLGSFYSSQNPPPIAGQHKWYKKFKDGTTIEYDSKSHVLRIDATGPINIVAAGNINVTGDVIADGVSLKNHTHPESVGTVTGPPGG